MASLSHLLCPNRARRLIFSGLFLFIWILGSALAGAASNGQQAQTVPSSPGQGTTPVAVNDAAQPGGRSAQTTGADGVKPPEHTETRVRSFEPTLDVNVRFDEGIHSFAITAVRSVTCLENKVRVVEGEAEAVVVERGKPHVCSVSPAAGQALVWTYFDGTNQPVSLDANGRAVVGVPTDKVRLPPASDYWAHVGVPGAAVTTPVDIPVALLSELLASNGSLEDIQRVVDRVGGASELPEPLRARYTLLSAQKAAAAAPTPAAVPRAAETDPPTQAGHPQEAPVEDAAPDSLAVAQEVWVRDAARAVAKAGDSAKKRDWGRVRRLLSAIPESPMPGQAAAVEQSMADLRQQADAELLVKDLRAHGRKEVDSSLIDLMKSSPGSQRLTASLSLPVKYRKVFDAPLKRFGTKLETLTPIFVRAVNMHGRGGLRVDVLYRPGMFEGEKCGSPGRSETQATHAKMTASANTALSQGEMHGP